MAINSSAYSPKQFSFLIAMQDDWGTINPDDSGSPDNPWLAVDVDSVGSPSLNLNQVLEPRNGSRVLQATDFFQDKLNKVIEVSVSGTATANSVFDTVFNADQAQAIAGNTQWFQFVAFGIYALTLLGVDNGKLPGWGRTAGYGFAILVLGAQLGSLFGLIPSGLFVPLFVLVQVGAVAVAPVAIVKLPPLGVPERC